MAASAYICAILNVIYHIHYSVKQSQTIFPKRTPSGHHTDLSNCCLINGNQSVSEKTFGLCSLSNVPQLNLILCIPHFLIRSSAFQPGNSCLARQHQLCSLMCLALLSHKPLITHLWIFPSNTSSHSLPVWNGFVLCGM